ncbi:MAG: NACHT domain-containing NTPase, partial [Phormidesmis sp. CAN_BIN44]|nr:NACHT domain-containing NTPase [Phormidesmis sp. CAN_BIN44]
KALSQQAFAEDVGVTRQTVSKFFRGQGIDRQYFTQICEELKLEWDEVVDKPSLQVEPTVLQENVSEIDAIVQKVRQKISASLYQRCGTLRVLDMSQPIKVSDVYTNVNVLEKISGRRRINITNLAEIRSTAFGRLDFDRASEEQMSGLEAVKRHSKLLVLGKPGSGKTTFLKHIAIQCISNEFKADQVPIFFTLKDFAEAEDQPSLLEYITRLFQECGVRETEVIEKLLNQGGVAILLDGLDEVRGSDDTRVFKQIRSFAERFYQNSFIMTCRSAAKEYGFEHFTEVEIADFNKEQIADFVSKWFQGGVAHKARVFIQSTQKNPRIQELAKQPLLLTLLCLAFEEHGEFPANRLELYQEVLDVLLRKWDAKRDIKRDQLIEGLSSQRVENLLSEIALSTFEKGHHFFRVRDVEQRITKYVQASSEDTSREMLQLKIEVILKFIEANYGLLVEQAKGIYSFSHLTFHEYFAAKKIASSNSRQLEKNLRGLVKYMADPRWRDVFLLTSEMLQNADYLLKLMRYQIDELIEDEPLQSFLIWVNQKACTVTVTYKAVTVRAFYFDLAFARVFDLVGSSLGLARACKSDLTYTLDPELALDLALDQIFSSRHISSHILRQTLGRTLDRAIDRAQGISPPLMQDLQHLKQQLPESGVDVQAFTTWWETNNQTWSQQLRTMVIKYRNLSHDWQFSDSQKEKLKQYYNANQLLLNCLNSDTRVTDVVRRETEETMLRVQDGAKIQVHRTLKKLL